jgi:DNA-binding transcriptional ArsR family regulator
LENQGLDKYCLEILLVLADLGYSSSFNKLKDAINEGGFEISLPTLSRHLKHLISLGYVTREDKGAQMKIYSVDSNKVKKIKGVWERAKRIARSMRENRNKFFSLSEKDQMTLVLQILSARKLEEIRAQIAHKLEPKSFEKRLELVFLTSPYLTAAEGWVIERSVKDEAYRERVLKVIDELLKPKTKRENNEGR